MNKVFDVKCGHMSVQYSYILMYNIFISARSRTSISWFIHQEVTSLLRSEKLITPTDQIHNVFYYRKFAKVMFYTCLSVILFTGGSTWVGTPPGQVHPPGTYTPWAGTPREQCKLGDTGNKRAVSILLECILVLRVIFYGLSFTHTC